MFTIHARRVTIELSKNHCRQMMNNIFDVFGPSPIRSIEQHMHKVYLCAKQLLPFFTAVLAHDWTAAQEIKEKIDAIEVEADRMKRYLRLHLPTGLFLPVGRTDILELLAAQDRIANKAQDIAGIVISRKINIPKNINHIFMEFLECCITAAKMACKAINELDQLLESGFRGSEVTFVEEMIMTLDEVEQKSDTMLYDINNKIFKIEKDLTAIDTMFLYKLIQWIGDLADHAQNVGGRLQILIAR
jgi:uncharacterized protein